MVSSLSKAGGMSQSSDNQQQSFKTYEKLLDFAKQIGCEMTTWEKTGQWQLSALSPLKNYPLFPGFEDTSPEELRVTAYECKTKANGLQEYQKMLNEKEIKHKQLRDALRSDTIETLQLLIDVFYKKPYQAFDPKFSLNKPASGFAFGDAQPSNSKSLFVFGDTITQSGGFQSSTNLIGGGSGTNNLFVKSSSIDSTSFGVTCVNSADSTFGSGSHFVSSTCNQQKSGYPFVNSSVVSQAQLSSFFGGSSKLQTSTTEPSPFCSTNLSQSTETSKLQSISGFSKPRINNSQSIFEFSPPQTTSSSQPQTSSSSLPQSILRKDQNGDSQLEIDNLSEETKGLYMLLSAKFETMFRDFEVKIQKKEEQIEDLKLQIQDMKKTNSELSERIDGIETRERAKQS